MNKEKFTEVTMMDEKEISVRLWLKPVDTERLSFHRHLGTVVAAKLATSVVNDIREYTLKLTRFRVWSPSVSGPFYDPLK